MKLRYVRVICVVMLCISASLAFAQPYRQLTAGDFSNNIPAGSAGLIAYTNCSVTMNYRAARVNGNYRLQFDVQLVLNRDKSWMNRSLITSADVMEAVLRHEQGHYQMGYLMQQEMLRQLNGARYTADYQNQTTAIFNRVKEKYRQLNLDYDEDTDHMRNAKQQQAWQNFLNRQVAQIGNLAMN